MSRSFTASDRSSLLRLASMMPKGSEERKTLLAGLRRVAAKSWQDRYNKYQEGPWDPELSKYNLRSFNSSPQERFKNLQKYQTVDEEYNAFEALSKADRLSLIREKIAPGLDLSSLTDAAITHLLFMGGKYPTAKGQPDLPSKKEIQKLERAALKENRALQRELKVQIDDLFKQMPKNERTPTGKAISKQIDALTPWLRALEAEVKTLKNPPTPAGAAKSSANFEQTLGLMTAALADPSMRLPDINKLWKRLLGLQQKTETALEIQGVLAGEGVTQRYRRRQDKANAKAKAVGQKKEEETQQVEERKKKIKARPPRPPVNNSPPHPIFKNLPRNYRGLPNVTRQRLMALAQDIEDLAGMTPSDEDRLKDLIRHHREEGSVFNGGNTGMTPKQNAEYRKLLKKAQPKRWLKALARAIEEANLAVKVYEGIRKPTRWDEEMFFVLSSQMLQQEIMDLAYNQPALLTALGADLGFKWKPKSVAKGGGSEPKGFKGRGHYTRPKSREKDDPWEKNNLDPWRRRASTSTSTGDFAMSDRKALIRLASTLSKGSQERKTLLASLKKASISEQTLDQLVDMAVESVGGDPTNSDITPALMGLRNKWNKAVGGALEKWLKKPENFAKLNLDSSVFRRVEDEDDIDMVVDALQEHRGGAGFLYYMEMEGHGVGTWDGDWDELFVDEDRTVSELSKYMERAVSREYQNLKNEIDEIAFASVPEDEDGYEDDSYARNRYATRGALIRLASSLPKDSDERKALLTGLTKTAYAPSDWRKVSIKAVEMLGGALAPRPDIGERVQKALKAADADLYRAFSTAYADASSDLNLMYMSASTRKEAATT